VSEVDKLREALMADVEPLKRMGMLVKLEDCRRPKFICRWTHHRWGKLRHQRELLRKVGRAA